MSDQTPAAPFTFKAAPQRLKSGPDSIGKDGERVEPGFDPLPHSSAETPIRNGRKRKAAEPEAPKRKRRARLATDMAVLKACLKQLRTLDPKDALRTVETLRVLFK